MGEGGMEGYTRVIFPVLGTQINPVGKQLNWVWIAGDEEGVPEGGAAEDEGAHCRAGRPAEDS